MTWIMQVPAAWQFGPLSAEAGRPRQVERAVAGTILKALLGPGVTPERLGPLIADFGNALAQWRTRAGDGDKECAAVLDALGFGAADPIPAYERAFCLVLYGLCLSLASGRLAVGDDTPALQGADEPSGDANDEGGTDASDVANDEGDDAEYVGGNAAAAATEKTRVVADIARLLPVWRTGSAVSAKLSENHARLVAKVLLEHLLEVLPSEFVVVKEPIRQIEDGQPRTRQRIVVVDPEVKERIDRLLVKLPFRFTMQPLAQPPSYRAARTAPVTDEEDSFSIALIGYRRTNAFLAEFLHRTGKSCDFGKYVDAVDAQQAVAWRINRPLLFWAQCLAELPRPPEQWEDQVTSLVREGALDEQAVADWRTWVTEHFYRPEFGAGARKRYSRPGEFLDNPLARAALMDLAGSDGAPPAFYLPWKADYRGRIYAETPWLTPQGGDLQRSLFEFAHGRPLDDAGVQALRRHGANLVRRDRLLGDLGITGRRVLTLEERERWVVNREEAIVQSAASPLAHTFWREVAAKPMQFLAFCLAYRTCKENPQALVHLPVQVDGTCNGLQHIAALTGDRALAQAVNVLPREDGLPGDIYSELAAAAQKTVGSIKQALKGQHKNPGTLHEADAWLASQAGWRGWLNRNAAKRVVMTVPYGASHGSQARYVLEEIADPVEQALTSAPAHAGAAAIVQAVRGSKEARAFVARCTRGQFRALRRRARQDDTPAREELERVRAVGAYVALAMVMHLRHALDDEFKSVQGFASWLETVAARCKGLPLMWLTPLRLPVCQDKFECTRSSLSVRFGRQTITLGVTRLEERVAPREQAQALLPNLIHSLDATHLAMAINAAKARGVHDLGSIHDCLLCHPNDAATLGQVVRQIFAKLYRVRDGECFTPEVLIAWERWMQLVSRLAAVRHAHGLIGALEATSGLGEQALQQFAQGEDPVLRAEAQHALDLLSDIRALDGAHQTLARMLLEYAGRVPAKAKGQGTAGPSRKHHELETPWPPLERAAQFQLGTTVTSDYFFS